MEEKFNCSPSCPNRIRKSTGKFYCYLASAVFTGLVCWSSVDLKYSNANGLDIQTKQAPVYIWGGYFFAICGLMGLDLEGMTVAATKLIAGIKS
jgi:hypothetical protein